MDGVYRGGCLCGRVRYEIGGPVGPAGYCHCTDFRRVTGSAFHVGVRVEAGSFRLVSGVARGYAKRGDSGRELTRHFCGDCGSPLYTTAPRHPDWIYVKAGSLDDPTVVEPGYEVWTASKVTWSCIPTGLPSTVRNRT